MRYLPLLFFMIFSLSHSQIDSGQLLYYSFNGNVDDLSINKNNGAAFGGLVYSIDRFGSANSAAYFDGVDDYIEFPNIAQLKPELPLSFSFWIKYDNDSYQNQVVFNTSFEENRSSGVSFNSTSSSNSYAINYGDGSYSYSQNTRNTFVSDKSISPNIWHHIVVIMTSKTDMKIYVDCQLVSGNSSGFGGSLTYSSTAGCIGRHDRNLALPPDYFKGFLDDFRYWNKALSVSDVNLLCNSTLSASDTDLSNMKFNVFPNPTSDFITIETNVNNLKTMVIYNSVGELVYKGGFKNKIDVSTFSSGVYFIKANTETDSISARIIIK